MDGHFPCEKLVGFGSHQPLVAEQIMHSPENERLEPGNRKGPYLHFLEFHVDFRESTC